MDFKVVFILFWLYAFLGFLMETIVVSVREKRLVNRGFLLGPYCPIYGTGAILLLGLKNYQTNELFIFLVSIIICSLVEYLTSYLLELIFKVRWWDYSDRFLNVNGRICLINSICFGLLGMLLVCYLNPFFINLFNNLSQNTLLIIAFLIFTITLIDSVLTLNIMFDIRKEITSFKEKTLTNLFKPNSDNTEEITKKIAIYLKEKSFIHKHLSKSYHNFKVKRNKFFLKSEEFLKEKKLEKEEHIFIVSTLISLVIGFILGKIFNKVGLFISLTIVLVVLINKIIERKIDGK